MFPTGNAAAASRRAGRGINARLQSEFVNMIDHRLDVRETGVGQNAALGITLRAGERGVIGRPARIHFPEIVGVDVGPAVINQSALSIGGHTMASAAERTLACVTAPPKQFQLFQPRGTPRCQADGPGRTHFEFALRCTEVVLGRQGDLYSPRLASEPMMWPVFRIRIDPTPGLWRENFIGRSPVAATVNKNGLPGRTQKAGAVNARLAGQQRREARRQRAGRGTGILGGRIKSDERNANGGRPPGEPRGGLPWVNGGEYRFHKSVENDTRRGRIGNLNLWFATLSCAGSPRSRIYDLSHRSF